MATHKVVKHDEWLRGGRGTSVDGSYRALTTDGATTEGKFYLQDGTLRYRSSRTTGRASLSEDQGKTTLTVMPADLTYHTGRAEYERIE